MEKRLSKQKSVNFPKKADNGGEVGNERGDRRRRSFKFSKKFPFVKGNKDEEEAGAVVGVGQAGPIYEAVQLQESESGMLIVKCICTYIHTYTNTHVHMYIHTLIHMYIHTLIHMYIHTYIH